MYVCERARKLCSYSYIFTNAISMQLLTILQTIIMSDTTKERGALLEEHISFVLVRYGRFFLLFCLMRKVGMTPVPPFLKGIILRVNALYLGMIVPLHSGICPLCVFSIKLCPIRGKNNASFGRSFLVRPFLSRH